ncbi:hypothetical protein GIB67_011555 [Kingdonia uniflora]|uniref:Uncharacterized protein n=1 Tax=Kingdonia uniflora TaxID=39325 RepID=A0A7J7NMB8_9MAGN|nr:hypothetical protein GIB67_011555 [Kingdonia uniflora]
MANEAPTWADQWEAGGIGDMDEYNEPLTKKNESRSSGKKKSGAKAIASTGFQKVKVAAIAGIQKVKRGTSIGLKWLKTHYRRKSTSK